MLLEEREKQEKEELFQTYIAQALWGLDYMASERYGYNHALPQYVELIHPETKKQDLTAAQIIRRTLELLG